MSPIVADLAAWPQTLTLAERAGSTAGGGRPTAEAMERARQRAARWRAQSPFDDPALWARRLAADGLDEERFLTLLAEAPDEVPRNPPEWLLSFRRAFAAPSPESWPAVLHGVDRNGFLHVVAPLVRDGCARLRAAVAGLPVEPDRAVELLVPSLAGLLQPQLARTLVLELHVARLEGHLEAASPEERFRLFMEWLGRPEVALELLGRYPVLARQVVEGIDAWVDAGVELLARLAADRAAIQAAFGIGEDDPVAEVRAGAGDRHRGGRSVTLLRFASGAGLVYKPKPLAVEAAFQGLLVWVNGRGFAPALRPLRVLDRGAWGWVERIAAAECANEPAVRRFYERQGGLLALLFALDGADVHSENLIAAGEHPVLVDLEALFHPWLDERTGALADGALPADVVTRSVLRVGLLPERTGGNRENAGIDLSGLGAEPGQMTPRPVLWVEGEGTDRMRFDRKRVPVAAAANRPRLPGTEVRLARYIEAIASGFDRMLRLLIEHRSGLLGADGPLAAFSGAEVRVILRPTLGYQTLLTESFHPDVLGNALLRDQLFDRLWMAVPSRPVLERVLAAERRALGRADIPLFTTRADAADLWTGPDDRLAGFFDSTGLGRVQRSLERISERDVALQLSKLRGSLAAVALGERAVRRPPYRLVEAPQPAAQEALLAAARAAGDRLAGLAFRDRDAAHWFGLAPVGDGTWKFGPVQADLYGGVPGIALFLARLGALTGEGAYTELARRGLAALSPLLRRKEAGLRLLGGYSGWGGILYMLVQLAGLWGDETLLDTAAGCVPRLTDLIAGDEMIDLLDGAAGCIRPLLLLHARRPAAGALDAARACGERVLARAQAQEVGLGWWIAGAGPVPLAGLSHGAAGISLALLELAAATGNERFRETARGGLAFERSRYDPRLRNWPDLRGDESFADATHPDDRAMCAWCHGAAGIGLARLGALPLLDDPLLRGEIDIAVETTLAAGLGFNHSLCHGDLGCLDVLLTAALTLGDAALEDRVYRLAGGVLADIAAEGWRFGMPEGAEPPGLMVGLAGIGYGLLRLARPREVPSVLLLQ